MGLLGGLFGMSVGVGVKLYSNALRKLPFARRKCCPKKNDCIARSVPRLFGVYSWVVIVP